jgi:methionyl-tRNA formyltransferase
MPPLRIIFMGTAELACPSLQALLQSPALRVVAVVTQPDRPKGRELKLQPSLVKQVALAAGVTVLQPQRARDENFIQELRRLEADLIVVAAYGQILPQAILDLPRFGCLNVHTSLLPKYRGAAPIQWALLNDERETGVTIMKMDAGLDTGPILTQAPTPISPQDNAATLHDTLAALGAELLLATIPGHVEGKILPRPQPSEGASYARKIKKEDGHLDWRQPAQALWNRIRAFTPWPGAFSFQAAEPEPLLLKIWEAQVVERAGGAPGEILQADKSGLIVMCGENAMKILTFQREGGKRLSARDFLAGHKLKVGQKLI